MLKLLIYDNSPVEIAKYISDPARCHAIYRFVSDDFKPLESQFRYIEKNVI